MGALAAVRRRVVRVSAGPRPEGLPSARPNIVLGDDTARPLLELLPAVEVLAGLVLGVHVVEPRRDGGGKAQEGNHEYEGEDLHHALNPRMGSALQWDPRLLYQWIS